MLPVSPITMTTASAPFAVATASWNAASASPGVCGSFFPAPGISASKNDGMSRRISGPGAYSILAFGNLAFRPCSTVTALDL